MVIDFDSRSFAILLTNRVHPSRNWGSNNPARRAVAQGLAESLAVDPRHGNDAWFTGTKDATTATLTTSLAVPAEGARVGFDLFVDSEQTDWLYLETSADGGTTWTKVPFDVRDRGEVTPTDGAFSDVRRSALAAGLGGTSGRASAAALAVHDGLAVRRSRGVRGRREGDRR